MAAAGGAREWWLKEEARVTRWSKTAGGAELGWQDALDGWWSGSCR